MTEPTPFFYNSIGLFQILADFIKAMHITNIILVYLSTVASASPMALPQGTGTGADSCPTSSLEPKTWTDLRIDDFLASAAKNYTRTTSNNVQSLAASFGAPNFFCGLDKFCNAGQPCLPIQPPAWYVSLEEIYKNLQFHESCVR